MATVGAAWLRPGIVTAVAGEAIILVDQRHPDAGALAAMLADARRASEQAARAEGCTIRWTRCFRARPQPFAAGLVDVVREVCAELTGQDQGIAVLGAARRDPDGRGCPTAMLFTSSTRGISHAREEDTRKSTCSSAWKPFTGPSAGVIASTSGRTRPAQ